LNKEDQGLGTLTCSHFKQFKYDILYIF